MQSLTAKPDVLTIVCGVYTSFTDIMGNTYIDTALKGIIGGAAAYLGKVIIVWVWKQIIKKYKQNTKKQI